MTYHTIDDWLSEIEKFAPPGATTSIMPWLEEAWRLGGEAERWAIECNADMKAGAESNIRDLLTAHGVPISAFIDDHVANCIAQRNILAEALIHARVGASEDRAAAIDAAIAKAYPSGVEQRALGDAVVRHLKWLADGGLKTEGREG